MKGSTRSRALPHHESENNTKPADNDRVRLRGDWLVERPSRFGFRSTAIFSDHLIARLRAEITFAVNAEADGVRFQVAITDNEHGVDSYLLRELDLGGGNVVSQENQIR